MADGFIPVQSVTADKKLDTTELTVSAQTVERERVVISGAAATELADVKNATPASSAYGVVTRKAPAGSTFYAVKRANITTSSVNLAFGLTSQKLYLSADPANTDVVAVDFAGGTAVAPAANTAGNFTLGIGESLLIDDIALTSISVIAASGTQTVKVCAWS